ncbi:MAG: HEAT repeat domain-containing protein [Fimbriimonadaceae bacterium]|nr:HEAT repeat domain-containing protein [Fimbriimonadaceae bacterium]
MRTQTWWLTLALLSPLAAQTDEATALAGLQAGDANARVAACLTLQRIGSAAAVPALASLLGDPAVAQAARQALEAIPDSAAGAALRAALATTRGAERVGVVQSLGARAEATAVPDLAGLLGDADPLAARTAARALGRIGTAAALTALRGAPPSVDPTVRAAVADGLLLCAEQLLASRQTAAAATVYRDLAAAGLPAHLRVAALRGLYLTDRDGGLARLSAALQGSDRAARQAALQAAADLPGTAVAATLAKLLPSLAAVAQVDLLAALRSRGDPAVVPALLRAQQHPELAVRLAAWQALGELADDKLLAGLADRAAACEGAELSAARLALTRLQRGAVEAAMIRRLPAAAPAAQAELARALASRRAVAAVPALLHLATTGAPPAALRATVALGELADLAVLPALVKLLASASEWPLLDAAEQAVAAVGLRAGGGDGPAATVLAALPGAQPINHGALLRAAGAIGGPAAVQAVRQALDEATPEVAAAALQAYAEAAPPSALEDLLALAQRPGEALRRVVALRGYWRLVALLTDRPAAERLARVQAGLAVCERLPERRLGLAELGRVHLPAALALAVQQAAGEAREEAELAALQIATALLGSDRVAAEPVLRRLAATGAGDELRQRAQAALAELTQRAMYLMPWQVCGPFREPGRECQALYDIALGPEREPADPAIHWQPAVSPPDPLLFWQVDLGGLTGGNHCLLYLRTRLEVPTAQPARLAIGTDDGIKLWLNGALVHANNAVRGLTPDEDKCDVQLRAGWNELFVKITQHTVGCGATFRLTRPDGQPIAGLRVAVPE